MDHAEVKVGQEKYLTQGVMRELMSSQSRPTSIIADMAFFTSSWKLFWVAHNVKQMPLDTATPWPNRADPAIRLFNTHYADHDESCP
eukprot:616962-Amphidinium_carterae.1